MSLHHEQHPKFTEHLHEEVLELFSDVQPEMIHCGLCGEYHPPELHPASVFDLEYPEALS